MKNYKDIANSVFERRDSYLAAKNKRLKIIKRTGSVFSCLCLAVLIVVGVWHSGTINLTPSNASKDKDIHETETVIDKLHDTVDDNNGNTINDNLPINFSSLNFSTGQVDNDIITQYSNQSNDIAPFDESMLSDCCAIIEGTITDMYMKHYSYDTYDDKFGKDNIYHHSSQSVVYELNISKVWYGDDELSEKTILIEDKLFFIDEHFSLKNGGTYVIPIYNAGDTLFVREDFAGGDIVRDSIYSTIYPFHPQIEITTDGNYVVSTDWKTLASGSFRIINMDTIPENEYTYYSDKMRLLDANTFEIQMNKLINNFK